MRVDLHLAELGQHRADAFGGRPADRARDHHYLGATELALDHVAQFLGIGVDDADAVHLGAGVAARRRKRIRVDVIDLAVAGRSRDVDELTADTHHRQPRPRVHKDTFTPDRRQQARPGPHR